jgi:hypothetical protein
LLALAIFLLISCGKSPQETLESRATGWADLLQALDGGEVSVEMIEAFIEPSAVAGERAREYYKGWSESLVKTIEISVDDVSVDNDGNYGTVRYSQIVELPEGGNKMVVSQVTRWKRVNGVWYRIIQEPEKSR